MCTKIREGGHCSEAGVAGRGGPPGGGFPLFTIEAVGPEAARRAEHVDEATQLPTLRAAGQVAVLGEMPAVVDVDVDEALVCPVICLCVVFFADTTLVQTTNRRTSSRSSAPPAVLIVNGQKVDTRRPAFAGRPTSQDAAAGHPGRDSPELAALFRQGDRAFIAVLLVPRAASTRPPAKCRRWRTKRRAGGARGCSNRRAATTSWRSPVARRGCATR